MISSLYFVVVVVVVVVVVKIGSEATAG